MGMVVALVVACGSSQTERNAAQAATYGAELEACMALSETATVAQDCACAAAKKWHRACPGIRSDGGMVR